MSARDEVRKWMINTSTQDALLDAYRAEVIAEAATTIAASTFVVMRVDVPVASAVSLDAAQAEAVRRDAECHTAEYLAERELRWDEHNGEWRLMGRLHGGRFSRTGYWVEPVPHLSEGVTS